MIIVSKETSWIDDETGEEKSCPNWCSANCDDDSEKWCWGGVDDDGCSLPSFCQPLVSIIWNNFLVKLIPLIFNHRLCPFGRHGQDLMTTFYVKITVLRCVDLTNKFATVAWMIMVVLCQTFASPWFRMVLVEVKPMLLISTSTLSEVMGLVIVLKVVQCIVQVSVELLSKNVLVVWILMVVRWLAFVPLCITTMKPWIITCMLDRKEAMVLFIVNYIVPSNVTGWTSKIAGVGWILMDALNQIIVCLLDMRNQTKTEPMFFVQITVVQCAQGMNYGATLEKMKMVAGVQIIVCPKPPLVQMDKNVQHFVLWSVPMVLLMFLHQMMIMVVQPKGFAHMCRKQWKLYYV